MTVGIDIGFISAEFSESLDWSFADPAHKVLVWRRGTAKSKEVTFERGPAGMIIPQCGGVWVIPAGQRAAALARGVSCDIAELTLPAAMTGSATLSPVVDRRDPLLHYMVERIGSVTGRTDVVGRLLRESLIDGLRLHILDRYGEVPVGPPERADLDAVAQRRLIEFLHDGIAEDIDLRTLARLVGMRVETFRRAFSRAFNTTPHQYILDQRIAKAKSLLTTTSRSITEIAMDTGFFSPSHFSTTFKRRVGMTPSAYRASA